MQCIIDQNSIDQKKASVSISTQNLPALGILNVLKTPYALAWSSLEIVQFITQWVLSLHGLSFSLCSLKRAEGRRPMRAEELGARPIRSLDSLNSPPIVWPSVRGSPAGGGAGMDVALENESIALWNASQLSFILSHWNASQL